MRIFANHAHVFPRAVREDGTVDALLRVMDDCGIEKAVAFATFPSFLGPGTRSRTARWVRALRRRTV